MDEALLPEVEGHEMPEGIQPSAVPIDQDEATWHYHRSLFVPADYPPAPTTLQ